MSGPVTHVVETIMKLLLSASTVKRKKQKEDTRKKKWAKFTCIGKETRFITKLFKNTDIKVTFTS